jgi:transcriptional regulator with XRE-family HTH domain
VSVISRKIIELRKAIGWSQTELARQSGVTNAAISQIEKGDRTPTLRVAFKISKALHITLGELTGEYPEEHRRETEKEFYIKFEVIDQLCEIDKDIVLKLARRLLRI